MSEKITYWGYDKCKNPHCQDGKAWDALSQCKADCKVCKGTTKVPRPLPEGYWIEKGLAAFYLHSKHGGCICSWFLSTMTTVQRTWHRGDVAVMSLNLYYDAIRQFFDTPPDKALVEKKS